MCELSSFCEFRSWHDFDSTPTDAVLGKDGVNAPWNSHVGSHAYQDIMDIKRADMVACLGQAVLIDILNAWFYNVVAVLRNSLDMPRH